MPTYQHVSAALPQACIDSMNLRSIDLNLLVVLDALLDEAHVTRASLRLNLSQPATSASLGRLRQLFNDPLLERFEGSMRLTPLAETLRERLKELLADAQSLINVQPQDLATIKQAVRIATADHMAADIVVQMHAHLARSAPGIDLVFQPYQGASAALDSLTRGSVDLAISIIPRAAFPFHHEELMRENWRVIMRKDHPAAKLFDLSQWLAYSHISVSGRGDLRVELDDRIAVIGHVRKIAVVVPSFLMVAPLVQNSDLLAMVPSRSLPKEHIAQYAVFDPPIEMPEFAIDMVWHDRHEADIAVQYVKSSIMALDL